MWPPASGGLSGSDYCAWHYKVLGVTKCSGYKHAKALRLVMPGGEAGGVGRSRRLVGLTSQSRLLRRNAGSLTTRTPSEEASCDAHAESRELEVTLLSSPNDFYSICISWLLSVGFDVILRASAT